MQESRQNKQADPRPVRSLTDKVCGSSVGTDQHFNCFETESHSNYKKHIQRSTVIKDTIMQESRQTQQADPRLVIDLMEEVLVCDICGDVGNGSDLAMCSKCRNGAEHIYCMRVMLAAVPGSDWMCEECMVRFGYKKSECETEGVCSTSHLPAKRPGAPLQASSVKKSWVGVRAIPPRSSKPCYRSCKNFKNGKVKATKSFTFELQMSCNSQEKAKAPRACVDKGKKHILEAGSGKKTRVLETKVTFPEASKPSNRSLLRRGHPFQNSGKAKLEAAHSVSFVKQSSSGFQEKPRLPKLHSQTKIARDKCSLLKLGSSKTGDLKVKEGMAKGGCFEKQKIERYVASDEIRKGKNARVVFKAVLSNSVSSEKLHATCSEVILEKAYRPVVFKNSNSSEQTNTARKKCVSKLDNPAMCFPASDPDATAARSGNKTIFPDETFSGPNCSRLDAVHSSGRIETGLQLNSHNTEKDQNCLHKETANEIQQAGRPAEAATAMKVHKLSTGLGSDERSQFEAATLPLSSQSLITYGQATFKYNEVRAFHVYMMGFKQTYQLMHHKKFLKWWTNSLRLLY